MRQENKGLKRILLAGKCVEKACHTESMPALPRLLSGQNLSFSGASQFPKRKFPSRQNEKHRQYLCVLPRLFMKRGRKFSFENPMFLVSPRLKGAVVFRLRKMTGGLFGRERESPLRVRSDKGRRAAHGRPPARRLKAPLSRGLSFSACGK